MQKSTRDLNKNGMIINQMNKIIITTIIALLIVVAVMINCQKKIYIDSNYVDINKAISSGGLTVDK